MKKIVGYAQRGAPTKFEYEVTISSLDSFDKALPTKTLKQEDYRYGV